MKKNLKELILSYQLSVRTAVELMQRSGIPLPLTSEDWVETVIPVHGELEGGISYRKHGYGCEVGLPSGSVDFDFGRMGEIDGFDSYRLIKFAGSESEKFRFENIEEIEESFKAAVKSGSITPSGSVLYFMAESKRTLAIEICRNFPSDHLPHHDQDEVLSLHAHSFLAADLMLENYKKLSSKLEKNKGLSQNDGVYFCIYFSSWLGFLYETCKGFENLRMHVLLQDHRPESFLELAFKGDEVGRLFKRHKGSLREFRNNIFHPRDDAKPMLQFAIDDAGRRTWAAELHSAMAEFFSMYRILCEVHYLTHDRLEESEIRKQQSRKKRNSK